MGNDPKLENILRMTASAVEPLDNTELKKFAARFDVDMTLEPAQATMQLLADLDHEGLLGRFHVEQLVTQERLQQALEATKQAESHLRGDDDHKQDVPQPPKKQDQKKGDGKGKKDKKDTQSISSKQGKKKLPPVIFYELALDESECSKVRALWGTLAGQAPHLVASPGYHCTLMFIGGKKDSVVAEKYPNLNGPEHVAQLRTLLESSQGTEVQFEVVAIAWDDQIGAAEVRIDKSSRNLAANPISHLTLALRQGIPPSMSNEMLCRRATRLATNAVDFKPHLGHWLTAIGLQKYHAAIAKWCEAQGAATVEEVIENVAELCAEIEPSDEEQRERIMNVLVTSGPAARGQIHEHILDTPLRLRGKVNGRRPGD